MLIQTLHEQIADSLWHVSRHWRLKTHPTRKGTLTPEQYWLLAFLHLNGPLRVSDLAQMLGTKPSSTTLACQRLERDGMVSRVRTEADERVVLVALTEQGQDVFRNWRQERLRALDNMLKPLDPGEQEEFLRLLRKISTKTEEGDLS